MSDVCRSRGVGFVLVYSPIPERPEPEVLRRIGQDFADFAHHQQFVYVDLTEIERAWRVKEITISLLDRHPNVLGHKLIAEALAPVVRRQPSSARNVPALAEKK